MLNSKYGDEICVCGHKRSSHVEPSSDVPVCAECDVDEQMIPAACHPFRERLTAERFQEIEARAAVATPGPWETVVVGDCENRREVVAIGTAKGWTPKEIPDADADFIAHAREDIPVLLATTGWLDYAIGRWKSEEESWKETEARLLTRIAELEKQLKALEDYRDAVEEREVAE